MPDLVNKTDQVTAKCANLPAWAHASSSFEPLHSGIESLLKSFGATIEDRNRRTRDPC